MQFIMGGLRIIFGSVRSKGSIYGNSHALGFVSDCLTMVLVILRNLQRIRRRNSKGTRG